MAHNIEDLVKPFNGDLNSITEDFLTQPFLIDKKGSGYVDGKLQHDPVMDFPYMNDSDKYIIDNMDKSNYFARQYCFYYRTRVSHLAPKILENAKVILGDDYVEPVSLGEVKADKKYLVIGCVFKRMQNRMSVLKDFDKQVKENVEARLHREEEMETLALDSDYLDIEDIDKQKATLKGNFDPYKFVTGMVVGVYGTQTDNCFNVEQMILPALPPYVERPMLENDVYVILISGFNINGECPSVLGDLSNFATKFLCEKYYNKIARIIFAGNSAITYCQHPCCKTTSINNVMPIGLTLDADKNESALLATNSIRKLFSHLDVDMMPGEGDPTSMMLPQQQLSRALFDDTAIDVEEANDEGNNENFETTVETFKVKIDGEAQPGSFGPADYWRLGSSGIYPSPKPFINTVTNPYCFKVMDVEFHGTSGQNVNSFRKLTKDGTPTLEIMKNIIETGLVIPTAPDFIDCFPYNRPNGADPLALDQLPHVFFAGNQPEFASKVVDFGNDQKVRIISIPKFEDTRSMVSINLRTLQVAHIVSEKNRAN